MFRIVRIIVPLNGGHEAEHRIYTMFWFDKKKLMEIIIQMMEEIYKEVPNGIVLTEHALL